MSSRARRSPSTHSPPARAQLAEAAGDHAEAVALYAEAAERWRKFGNVPERAYALLGQGRCLAALGNPEAKEPLREARELFASMGFTPAVAEDRRRCSALPTPRLCNNKDLNLRPPGYEPGELPDCSTPRRGPEYSASAAVFDVDASRAMVRTHVAAPDGVPARKPDLDHDRVLGVAARHQRLDHGTLPWMAVRIADDHDELPAVERDFRYSGLVLEATQLDAGSGCLDH